MQVKYIIRTKLNISVFVQKNIKKNFSAIFSVNKKGEEKAYGKEN